MKKIFCKYCNKELDETRHSISYCSNFCYRTDKKLRISPSRITKCSVCGTDFQSTHGNKLFCSIECKAILVTIKSPVTTSYFSIFDRDSFTCIYCGKTSIEDKVKLQVDHVVPLSKGGQTHVDNLVTSCKTCNVCKNNKILSHENIGKILLEVAKRNNGLQPNLLTELNIEIIGLKKRDNNRKQRLVKGTVEFYSK